MLDVLNFLRTVVHYNLHFVFPGLIAWVFFRDKWKYAWLLMATTILVDIDHLMANPIFDPNRCSLGFHPLHSYYAIAVYLLMLFMPSHNIKIIATGLLFHMLTDFQDCFWIKFLN